MARRILIVPDKFKGSLSASDAALAIARGWRRIRAGDEIVLLPMSDGGDGFGETLAGHKKAKPRHAMVCDAAHRRLQVRWWFDDREKTAIVESARVIGLARLPRGQFHPFELDTGGLGMLLRKIARLGARRCFLGLGGSATNDGGFGLARVCGWEFLDVHQRRIDAWTGLNRLATVVSPARRRLFRDLIGAVDVQNKLLGVKGASRVYGPQKGLRPVEVEQAERCLKRLGNVLRDTLGAAMHLEPGSGAAGGLGFGLLAFLGGRLESGFDLFARLSQLRRQIRNADVVVTAEGSIDRSSLMGKGVGGVARLCAEERKPCLGIGGVVEDSLRLRRVFHRLESLSPGLTDSATAIARAAQWTAVAGERLASRLDAS